MAHRDQDGRRACSRRNRHGSEVPYAALELTRRRATARPATRGSPRGRGTGRTHHGRPVRASLYAFDLVQKRAKRPAGAPDKALARTVTKVGIIGAGLMASQFALLFVAQAPGAGASSPTSTRRASTRASRTSTTRSASCAPRAGLDADSANRLRALITGTTDKAEFADGDFVIEAVFEELGVKQQVFAEIEQIIAEDAVLATNTSSLSVERDRREARPPRAPRRLPLLQPGRRDAAHRDRQDADHG